MALNLKQQRFVDEYLRCGNATAAAKRAGYSANSAYSIGSENLKKPEIADAIQARVTELGMSKDEVLARLADIGRGSMANFTKVDRQGELVLDFRKGKRHLHQIRKVKRTTRVYTTMVNGDETPVVETVIEFELYDAQAALVQLGKHHKLFTERIEVDDWRREMADAGLNPDDEVKRLEDEFVEHLLRDAGEAGRGGVEAGDSAD